MLALAAGIALLTACSGGSSSTGSTTGQSTAYQKALAYAQCIRAHGAPNYPDPNSQGQFVIPNGSSNSSFVNVSAAAQKACQSLEPPSMAQGPPQGGQGASTTNKELKFAECMRSHGAPNYPDPAANGSFTLPSGANPESPQWQAADKACQSLMPNNPGGGTAP